MLHANTSYFKCCLSKTCKYVCDRVKTFSTFIRLKLFIWLIVIICKRFSYLFPILKLLAYYIFSPSYIEMVSEQCFKRFFFWTIITGWISLFVTYKVIYCRFLCCFFLRLQNPLQRFTLIWSERSWQHVCNCIIIRVDIWGFFSVGNDKSRIVQGGYKLMKNHPVQSFDTYKGPE